MKTYDYAFQNNKLVADILLSMLTVAEENANYGLKVLRSTEDF